VNVLFVRLQRTAPCIELLLLFACFGVHLRTRLLGMQRVLSDIKKVPDVLELMDLAKQRYGDVSKFPFNEIVRDIKVFTYRNKRNSK